jgi:hypothetical protein
MSLTSQTVGSTDHQQNYSLIVCGGKEITVAYQDPLLKNDDIYSPIFTLLR